MIIKCKKHGEVLAVANRNYDIYCPFCIIEGLEKYGSSEKVKHEDKIPQQISMGCSIPKNKCKICSS